MSKNFMRNVEFSVGESVNGFLPSPLSDADSGDYFARRVSRMRWELSVRFGVPGVAQWNTRTVRHCDMMTFLNARVSEGRSVNANYKGIRRNLRELVGA